jgi:hypothetical protein
MWLGDPIQYKHYDELVKLSQCLLEDYSVWKTYKQLGLEGYNWKQTYAYYQQVTNNSIKYDESEHDTSKYGVNSFALFHRTMIVPPNELLAKVWKSSIEQAKKCPGMDYLYVNTLAPRSITPEHTDDFLWKTIELTSGQPITKNISISFAVDIPDPTNQPLIFGDKSYSYGTGEFVAFDGRHIPHSVTNDSDLWRVSGMLQISGDHWI